MYKLECINVLIIYYFINKECYVKSKLDKNHISNYWQNTQRVILSNLLNRTVMQNIGQ